MRPEALLILGTPGPNPARLAAMMSRHPDAALLPELALGMAKTLGRLQALEALGQRRLRDGWLRALALLEDDDQDEARLATAENWLARRTDWSLRDAVDALRQRLAPRAAVLTDGESVWRIGNLEAAIANLPGARVLHVTEHPMQDCARMAERQRGAQSIPIDYRDFGTGHDRAALDPQLAWLRIHETIMRACAHRDGTSYRLVDWHRLAQSPEDGLSELLDWLGWRRTAAALVAMQRPQDAALACRGPARAPGGLDPDFLRAPDFAPRLAPRDALSGPVPWRDDGAELAPEVIALARRFGYR